MLPNRRHVHHIRQKLQIAALLLPCLAGAAQAQTSANVSVVSEYAARGILLSSGPVAQLRVDHDTDEGWYAGGFVSPATMNARSQAQAIVYAGRARRLSSALAWDAGLMRTVYSRDGESNYHEFYAGLALRRASVHLFYSPSYYGIGRTAYVDLSGAYGLADHLSLAAHAGVLHAFDGLAYAYTGTTGAAGAPVIGSASRNRLDARLLLVTDVGDYTLQGGWQGVWRIYPAATRGAHGLVVSASLHF